MRILRILAWVCCCTIAAGAARADDAPPKRVLSERGEQIIQELLAQLDSAQREERLSAINKLGQFKEARALERLLEIYHEDETELRVAAVQAVGTIGDKSRRAALMKGLAAQPALVRLHLCNVLAEWGESADLVLLLDGLEDRAEPVRAAALGGLQRHCNLTLGFDPAGDDAARAKAVERWRGWWQTHSTVDRAQWPLSVLVLGTNNEQIRALAALAQGGRRESLPQIVPLLTDDSEVVRQRAAECLSTLARRSVAMDPADETSCRRARDEWSQWLKQANLADEAFIHAQGLQDASARNRMAAIEYFKTHPQGNAVDLLIGMLEDKAETVRAAASVALFELTARNHGFDAAAPEAERAKAVERWREWRAASLDSDPAALIMAAFREEGPAGRRLALEKLTALDRRKAVDALIDALGDETYGVRKFAIDSLYVLFEFDLQYDPDVAEIDVEARRERWTDLLRARERWRQWWKKNQATYQFKVGDKTQ